MTDHSAKKLVGGAAASSRQVLTFRLGEETYGVDILRVKEIRGWSPVTRIPKSPSHVLGVLNLRGSIVPIVDLRVPLEQALKLGLIPGVAMGVILAVDSLMRRRHA